MAIINLRRYYPHYLKDKFLEVPDEVADALEEGRRMEHRQDNRRSYYHVYSMDCTPAIENHAMFLMLSPEELLIRDEDEAAAELVLANLAAAMTLLSPTQARRLHARYALKKKFREIAADEGISGSCAAASVTGAITKLQMYAKDISTKIKSTLHTKARRGEYLGALDPYGYLRHPDDKHKLIINEETAPVVRRMFEMCAAGIGARSIATTLNNEGILSPKEYTRFRKHNPERDGEFERRHFWTRTYVHFMLQNEIYVGSMVQGRQYTPSYRSKKREPIPKEDWVVVPDMHEPIISRELFDEAQKRLIARKKTIKAKDELALFAGLFYCEACGTSMKLGVSQQKYFYYMCGRSQAIGTVACSSHYINRDTLYQVVQEDIQRNARLFSEDTEKAAQKLMELKCADQQKQTATMKRDLASAKKRLADLDMKLKRTYEDNMSGKLPDHIFTMFIADYDTERATLKANIAEMEKALEKVRDTKADIDRFADLIRKYTSFEKLDRFMLHELIDRITIYETPGMGRCRKGKEKRITIYYKFVGAIQ